MRDLKMLKGIRKQYVQNSIFKFMVSYTIVLLLPLMISMLGFQIAFNIVEEDIKDTSLSMINHSKNMVDSQLKSLDMMAMQVATSSTVYNIAEVRTVRDSKLFIESPRAIDYLANMLRYSHINILKDLYVYLAHTEYVITSNELYQGSFYYNHILKNSALPYEQWKMQMISEFNYARYVVANGGIQYVQSIPGSYNEGHIGTVIGILDIDEVVKLFDSIDLEKGSYMYIQNAKGELIGANDVQMEDHLKVEENKLVGEEGVFSDTINQQKSLVIYTTSEINDWKYVLVLPEKLIMNKLLSLQRIILTLFFSALAGGICISYYMAKTNGKPLNEIIKVIKGEDLPIQLHLIGGTISELISRNRFLIQEFEKQKPLLETAFFQKLVRGEFSTTKEFEILAKRASIDLNAPSFVVAAFRVFANNEFYEMDSQTLEEVNVISFLVRTKLKDRTKNPLYFYEVDYLTTAIIVPIYEENDAQYLQDLIQNVHEMVVAETKVAPSWGISKACEEALEIWKAYEEAKKALLAAAKEKQISIMSYSDLIEDSTSYYYTPSFTQRIRNYTKTGDIQNIEHLVEMLYIENAQKRHLDKIVIGKLHENIKATIMQLIHTEEMSEEAELRLDDLEKIAKEDMRAYFNELKKVFVQISNLYNRAKQSNQSRLITKIMDYINETYKDSSLGLGMVAAQFNISEGYISTLFKDQANINFTEYVEGLRITRACDLLENTETTISDIATQVGYNSVQSFRRAFKRIHGVSPSELRKKE